MVADHSGSDSLQMDPTTGVWLAQRYTATGIPYSHTTGTPTLANRSADPMPEHCSNCGEPIVPADRITSAVTRA